MSASLLRDPVQRRGVLGTLARQAVRGKSGPDTNNILSFLPRVQTRLGLSYGIIPPPPPGTDVDDLEITSDESTSMTANVLQLNVYFDTLSEQVIETKATYKV